jgi:hypothetical protein
VPSWRMDPFQQHGLVRYEIFEFTPVPLPRRSEELEAFLNKPLHSDVRRQASCFLRVPPRSPTYPDALEHEEVPHWAGLA